MVSKKPGKQRRKGSDAPLHLKRKRIRARLVTDDPELQAIRTVTVRGGDEVEVVRGDFGSPNSIKTESRGKRLGQSRGRSGVKAKVASVDTERALVYLDGMTSSTADGKEEGVPIRASNIVVTSLFDGDQLRIKRLLERAGGDSDE